MDIDLLQSVRTRPMSIFNRISKHGWIYSGEILFNRIVPKWLFRCRRYAVYRLQIQSPGKNVDASVTVGWATTETQIAAVEQLTHFRREFSSGPVYAVEARVDGQLAGGFWSASNWFDEDELGVRVILAPNQAWLFAALVNPEYRGCGIYSRILRFISSELAAQGKTEQLVAVNPDNKPSNSVHMKHAESRLATVFAARFVNWSICFASPQVKLSKWFTTDCKLRPIEISFSSPAPELVDVCPEFQG